MEEEKKKTDIIDMTAGIILNKKVGDFAKKGELLCTLYTNKEGVDKIVKDVKEAFLFQDGPVEKTALGDGHLIE